MCQSVFNKDHKVSSNFQCHTRCADCAGGETGTASLSLPLPCNALLSFRRRRLTGIQTRAGRFNNTPRASTCCHHAPKTLNIHISNGSPLVSMRAGRRSMGGGDMGGMGGAQLPFTFPALTSTNSGNASGQARCPVPLRACLQPATA